MNSTHITVFTFIITVAVFITPLYLLAEYLATDYTALSYLVYAITAYMYISVAMVADDDLHSTEE